MAVVACLFFALAHPANAPLTPIAAAAPDDALRTFHALGLAHALVAITFILCASIVLSIGSRLRRRDPSTAAETAFAHRLGVVGLLVWILANGYGFLPGVFEWRLALPIHVCDIAALLGPLVMLRASPPPWMRGLLYFAGIGLCTQAFITPTLHEGPADPQFWCFWSGHFFILIPALYELIVRRWRPTWRHWRIACGLSLGYVAVMLPLNLASGWNYGFVGPETKPGTIIEVLGPWPWRVGVMVLLTAIAYTCMMLPWTLRAHNAGSDDEGGRPGSRHRAAPPDPGLPSSDPA